VYPSASHDPQIEARKFQFPVRTSSNVWAWRTDTFTFLTTYGVWTRDFTRLKKSVGISCLQICAKNLTYNDVLRLSTLGKLYKLLL
jgi:hypothetical protein